MHSFAGQLKSEAFQANQLASAYPGSNPGRGVYYVSLSEAKLTPFSVFLKKRRLHPGRGVRT